MNVFVCCGDFWVLLFFMLSAMKRSYKWDYLCFNCAVYLYIDLLFCILDFYDILQAVMKKKIYNVNVNSQRKWNEFIVTLIQS